MSAVRSDEVAFASVVIPAHNEQQALPRHLESLLAQDLDGVPLELVVVVNGSTDATATVARGFVDRFALAGHRLEVVEIETASKAAALNEGDRHVTAFPRLYLDADIDLSATAIRRTVEELSAVDTPMLAAPGIRVAESSHAASRHYGRVWAELPYIRSKVPGVGFYAVNEAGRQRWWRFPIRLGADDKFVRLQFVDDETLVVDDATFVVHFPQRLGELLRVRGRWTSFNVDIARVCPRLVERDTPRWRSSIRFVATNPSIWASVPAFLMVWSGAWVLALLRRAGVDSGWSRASSSPMRAATQSPDAAAVPQRRSDTLTPTPRSSTRRCVHVGVVTYNSASTAPRCIERILDSQGLDALRVTVIDNASGDSGPEMLAELYPGVEVIVNDTNVGFAAAANQAFEHSTSHWLAIVNPDTEIRPDSISTCVEYLEEHPASGVCGISAVGSEGTVNDRSYFMRPTIGSELTLGLGAHRLAPGSRLLNPEQYLAHQRLEAPFEVDAIAGCFAVIDRSLFAHLDGYDEGHFLCGEDLDLGMRASEAGASPTVLPAEPILHHSAHSFSTTVDARVAYLRGRAEFEQRWWPASRATIGDAIRRAAIIGRLAVARLTRSTRRDDFSAIWAQRDLWSRGPIRDQPARRVGVKTTGMPS